MYEIPFSKMIQPRLGATWAYNGKDTVYASYARYNPAASSLPRAASWDRNLIGTFVDVHFDAERRRLRGGAGGLLVGQAVRARHDAAHGRRVPGRHGAPVHPPLDRPGSTARYRERQPLLGGHEQQRPRRLQPAGGDPARALHPEPRRRSSPRSAAARPTSSPSSTAPTPSTTRSPSSRSGAATRPSCAAPTPGATTTATSTRTTPRRSTTQHLHRLVVHRRRRRAPALELQGRHPARRPSPHAEGLRLPPAALEGERRRLLRLPVRAAVGDVELRAVPAR